MKKFTKKQLIISNSALWRNNVISAGTFSKIYSEFKNLNNYGEDIALRASYFKKLSDSIIQLGIYNPEESHLLTLEPFHPFPPSKVSQYFSKIDMPSSVLNNSRPCGLSIICLPLVGNYFQCNSIYEKLIYDCNFSDNLYLVDPYYGIMFWREGNHIRNTCFAMGNWLKQINILPKELADDLRKNPVQLLYEGVTFGRLCIEDKLGKDIQTIYQSGKVPEFIVKTEAEYLKLIETLKKCCEKAPLVELWFRGQPYDYLMPDREILFKENITTYNETRDSSLVPSIYRIIDKYLEYLQDYEFFIQNVFDWVCKADILNGPKYKVRMPWEESQELAPSITDMGPSIHWKMKDKDGQVKYEFVKDFYPSLTCYQRGLLLQHYGHPTSWLDITNNPIIALWFALNKLNPGLSKGVYSKFKWNSSEPSNWPTIYIFPLVEEIHPILNSGTILNGTPALRPQRQNCGLLGAAGNLARNYPSRYIMLKIRLSPSFKLDNDIDVSFLFPGPEEDGLLKELIEVENDSDFKTIFKVFNIEKSYNK